MNLPAFDLGPMRTQNRVAAAGKAELAGQADSARKRRNWLNSALAAAALIAASSLGGVLVYDWYFSFVLDGLSESFRPIADALHQGSDQGSGNHSEQGPSGMRK
jgi:hypothetical protein